MTDRPIAAPASSATSLTACEARAELVAFLDADDEWLPQKIERQMTLLRANGNVKWCASNLSLNSGNRGEVTPIPQSVAAHVHCRGEIDYFRSVMAGLHVQTSGFLIRRSVIDEVGGFNATLRTNEDRDLWWRIAMRYPRLCYITEPCYRQYLDVPGSLTKESRSRSAVVENICDNLKRASACGPNAARAFWPYARRLVCDYLLRAAGRQISIEKEVVNVARELFPLTLRERILLALLATLPEACSRRIVNRLRL